MPMSPVLIAQAASAVSGKVQDWALEVTGLSKEQVSQEGGRQDFYKKFALYKVSRPELAPGAGAPIQSI
jgi:hypothetical protein